MTYQSGGREHDCPRHIDPPQGLVLQVSRSKFPAKVKAAAFKRCCDANGIPHCEDCGIVLTAGNIEYDHDKADGLGGEPTLENCKVRCKKVCHRKKTHEQDRPIMAKADAQRKASFGLKPKSSRPMPGGRDSKWKKKIGGGVVLRNPR